MCGWVRGHTERERERERERVFVDGLGEREIISQTLKMAAFFIRIHMRGRRNMCGECEQGEEGKHPALGQTSHRNLVLSFREKNNRESDERVRDRERIRRISMVD